MGIATAAYNATRRGITAKIQKEMNAVKLIYPMISDVRKSTSKDEEYLLPGSTPGVQKWIGDRDFKRLTSATVEVSNDPWESSIVIDRFNYDDDRLGLYGNSLTELAQEAVGHKDELCCEFLVKGETTACWDGQNFFDTDHAWRDSGTQNNIVTLGVVDSANPTPAEMKKAFRMAVRRIKSFKKDNGKRYYRSRVDRLSDFTCWTPIDLQTPLDEAFDQKLQVEVAGNGAASNVVYEKPNVVGVNLINSDDSYDGVSGADTDFYVFYTGSVWKPLVFQPRSEIKSQIKGLTGDDIEFKDIKVMTEARYNFGYLAWMYAIKVKLTTL